mmetsp:Transcript_21274/g.54914  ORF Transcript_21274/g.54914 Transcript_21274/m.54914 type:complete len:217 (-) Transcript_21274:316-966(-)
MTIRPLWSRWPVVRWPPFGSERCTLAPMGLLGLPGPTCSPGVAPWAPGAGAWACASPLPLLCSEGALPAMAARSASAASPATREASSSASASRINRSCSAIIRRSSSCFRARSRSKLISSSRLCNPAGMVGHTIWFSSGLASKSHPLGSSTSSGGTDGSPRPSGHSYCSPASSAFALASTASACSAARASIYSCLLRLRTSGSVMSSIGLPSSSYS